jgi:hypothetical protein
VAKSHAGNAAVGFCEFDHLNLFLLLTVLNVPYMNVFSVPGAVDPLGSEVCLS